MQNIGDMPVELKRGERIAQLIPMPLISERLHLERVEKLTLSERGERAFGSSGR